jgi:alcohol dehydrogenase
MRAIIFDGRLQLKTGIPIPEPPPGWALIRVKKAGICGTDLEITEGYKGFHGVLGHEFSGIVEQCDHAEWNAKRVVGEINVGCGKCRFCKDDMESHCRDRRALGILGLNGCFADYCILPLKNLRKIPDSLKDDQAVFIEPLSAACQMLMQLNLGGAEKILVLGDGRLGILCAWVLSTIAQDVTLVGHHSAKLAKGQWRTIKTVKGSADLKDGDTDIVIEATGSWRGLKDALSLCRPRGTIVQKSTLVSKEVIDLTPLVINELTLLGSRCGSFDTGLQMLKNFPHMPLERLISGTYSIEDAHSAFQRAKERDCLKVLIDMTSASNLTERPA